MLAAVVTGVVLLLILGLLEAVDGDRKALVSPADVCVAVAEQFVPCWSVNFESVLMTVSADVFVAVVSKRFVCCVDPNSEPMPRALAFDLSA